MIDRQQFCGYSGVARVFGGAIALLGAFCLSQDFVPYTYFAHIVGWGLIATLSMIVNVGALFVWYLRRSPGDRRPQDLRPVIDIIAPLVVGGIVTLALLQAELLDPLFGIWMCLFGLLHIASRHSLTKATWHLGWFYIACGTFYLFFWPEPSFLNPWPMGVVFFIGELAGGTVFSRQRLLLESGEDA